MKRPRVTITRLMVAVGVVAINLGVGRAFLVIDPSSAPESLCGVAPMALLMQLALILSIRRRRARAFSAGFVVFGCAALFSFFLCLAHEAVLSTGGSAPNSSASPAHTAWTGYLDFADERLERNLPACAYGILGPTEAVTCFALLVILTAPQFLLAVAGGLLSWGIASVGANRLRRARVSLSNGAV